MLSSKWIVPWHYFYQKKYFNSKHDNNGWEIDWNMKLVNSDFTGNQSNSLSNNATFLCCKPAEKTHRTDLDSGCLINLMYNRILSNLLSCCYNKFRYDWMQCAIYKINCISCISKEWSIYIFSLVGSPSSLKVAY